MQQEVREMKPVGVGVPETVIEKIRYGLDRAVMGRKGLQKEVMAEAFQNQERALDEWILPRQVLVVPDALAVQARGPDEQPGHE
jgi:hypothetical protein